MFDVMKIYRTEKNASVHFCFDFGQKIHVRHKNVIPNWYQSGITNSGSNVDILARIHVASGTILRNTYADLFEKVDRVFHLSSYPTFPPWCFLAPFPCNFLFLTTLSPPDFPFPIELKMIVESFVGITRRRNAD